jgi:DNA-binding transcriptional regulator PaaX
MKLKYKNPPKVRIFDILEWMQNDPHIFTSKELSEQFGMTMNDASVRLERMRRWGFLKYEDRRLKKNKQYILTDYGLKFQIPGEEKVVEQEN